MAQFLRITSQPVPHLRESGVPDDLAAVVESAMNRDPHERPSAAGLGEAIREVQHAHGYQVTEMALHDRPAGPNQTSAIPRSGPARTAPNPGYTGDLEANLTSFVGRRAELSEIKNLLSASRLVTLAGIGGVGKTRLARRAAWNVRREFADGVRMIELADVRDPSLVADVVVAGLGIRCDSARPVQDMLVEFLRQREMLLVIDNGEQVVQALAPLVETLLVACPSLRILATSREPLDIAGEAVLRVLPLSTPVRDGLHTLRGLARFDAVSLFADRAAAVVRGFDITEGNSAAVAGICSRLDGLPLAIELAAARMRTMSPEQILERLTDRYALLTRGTRTAPRRQRTLRWCIDWSYQLCTEAEQRLWARLSVFAGGFELDAAEQICGTDLESGDVLDALSALVDKSVVLREEPDGVVRFRMLETLREYGREQLQQAGEHADIGRRHRDWYQRLAVNAEVEWVSDRQLDWLARLDREQPNLRDALEFSLSEDSENSAEAGLRTAAALFIFWDFRGLHGEGRRWLDRTLAHPRAVSMPGRLKALHASTIMASLQRDLDSAAHVLEQERTLADQDRTPLNDAMVACAEGLLALYRDETRHAVSCLERAVEVFGSMPPGHPYVAALMFLGSAHAAIGDIPRAIGYYEKVLSVSEASGESLFRPSALWGRGIAAWRQGEHIYAQALLQESLRVDQRAPTPVVVALDLEGLAWTGIGGDNERAAVLMGAAEHMLRSSAPGYSVFPELAHAHEECERAVRQALGARRFGAEFRRGQSMERNVAVAFALGEEATGDTHVSEPSLTKREQQVADLVAQGFTNKQIAAKLVIAQRTAEGHVEHILTKRGFTSRAQIAAWIIDTTQQERLRRPR